MQRFVGQTGDGLHMLPGGDLGHHPAVDGVHVCLGGDTVAKYGPPIPDYGGGGLVAGGFKSQNIHVRSSPFSPPGNSRVIRMASSLGRS
ncbi:hypothetical protein SDC9_208654 [bioreactor metagenome]|uniref:Uncharacterized protein n=1 Tax=bioreactor metagenome TaxID=1076179 RepID=A0A645JBA3_9ZZZZ